VRVIYFGSSSFSVPPLKSILPAVSCVVTRKAKPKGRGYQIEVNDVKRIASENNIPIIELDSFKDDTARQLEQYKPDFLVVASFGLIIPKWILDMPSIGPVNIHPSLLPRYRGPSPIQWALWNGERETGITFIKMNEKMDQGDILYQETTVIDTRDDMITLSDSLALRAGEILPHFLENIDREKIDKGTVQEESEATYTPIITKEMGRVDWSLGALEISRQVKALVLWPTAYTYLDGVMLKVFGAWVYNQEAAGEAGLISGVTKEGIVVSTPNGTLLIAEVQLENRKRLKAYQFAQGYRGLVGKKLG
jgi:methionyl-tRNA formyltransferase